MENSTWSLLGSAVTSYAQYGATINAGDAAAGAYGVQARQSERAAEWAIEQAEFNNIKLQRVFNETVATQAATFAAQGRSFSSGSVQNIIASDEADLEWELDFNMSEAEKMATAYREDAQGYLQAGQAAQSGAKESGSLGLLGAGLSIASSFF